MSCIEDREFEPLVREAMLARPQPRSISNLAYRAIELARQQARALAHHQLEGLLRLRRRRRWIGAVAAALVVIILAAGARHLSVIVAQTTATAMADSADGTSSDSISTTLSGNATLPIGLIAELIAVALILISSNPSSRPDIETLI